MRLAIPELLTTIHVGATFYVNETSDSIIFTQSATYNSANPQLNLGCTVPSFSNGG